MRDNRPTVQEHFEVSNLLARYCWAFDTCDLPALFALFAPEIVVETRAGRFVGAAVVRDYYAGLLADPVYRGKRHQFENLILSRGAAGLSGRSYWIVMKWTAETNARARDARLLRRPLRPQRRRMAIRRAADPSLDRQEPPAGVALTG